MKGQLIQLLSGLIISPDEIKSASRCGNYTDVILKDRGHMLQIWDEDKVVWHAITKAAESSP